MLEETDYIKDYDAVSNLNLLLNYELSSSILYLLAYFYILTIFFSFLAAILLTQYMVFVLYREKRFGWLLFFALLMVFPSLFSILLGVIDETKYGVLFLMLGLFYFYCFLIKFSVREWINNHNWRQHYKEQKKESQLNFELWKSDFKNKNNLQQ